MLVTRRINRFWSRVKGFIKFWSGHNLNPKNHTRKINKFSNDFSIISSLRTYIHTYIFFENISIPPNHILLTPTKNIFITFVHFSHHLAHILLSANLYFVLVKIGSILFYHLLTCTNPTILQDDAMLQALILCLHHF